MAEIITVTNLTPTGYEQSFRGLKDIHILRDRIDIFDSSFDSLLLLKAHFDRMYERTAEQVKEMYPETKSESR